MPKFYAEDSLKAIFRANLDYETYLEVCEMLKRTPKSDVIPVTYLKDYAKGHDAVCEMNILTMISCFKEGENET